MAHHAYFVPGDIEAGISAALLFAESELGLAQQGNPDVVTLRHGLLSVDDARRLQSLAELSPTQGDKKVLIVSASRIFHEAQNALLKFFEEPPTGTTVILVLPAEGMLLPTLRSRLLVLPGQTENKESVGIEAARAFLAASGAEREKIISKMLDRAKSDKDEEKQAARLAAIQLVEGLMVLTHTVWIQKPTSGLQAFLSDLDSFLPILHERSAPLKLIFEHIQLVMPASL